MKRLPGALFVLCVLLLPAIASAQATLSGTVRDSSGAILPGVSVEAASPALIEKVRTATTDGSGQYRITDLPPGQYTLTFTLSGFNTVKRQGVTVSGSGVIPISIDLSVGTLTETLTVTGEAPLVDTQTTRRETVINSEIINSLPMTRNYGGVLYATPGLVVQPGVNANDLMPSMALFSAHGGQSTEGRVFVNGVSVNGPFGSNSVTQFAFDVSNAEEMQVLVSGGLGESETGGPIANIVPRSGGNNFSGNAFYSGSGSKLQSDNLDDRIRGFGIERAPTVRSNWDTNFALGGPIKRDRLWFYGNIRSVGVAQVVEAGIAPNRFLGDPNQWLYEPVPGIEVRQVESKLDTSGRLTAQVTKRNRVTFSYTFQDRCQGSSLRPNGGGCREPGSDWIGAPANSDATAPEAGSGYMDQPTTLTQATYTSPLSPRLLVDAALSRFAYGQIGNGKVPPDSTIGMIGVTERSNRYGRAGISYRAPLGWGVYDAVPWNWRASVAYVTGAHNAKIGYQGTLMKYDFVSYTNPSLMRYFFNTPATSTVGVPIGVTYTTTSYFENANRAEAHAIFVQDQWTRGRLSLQGALRWDGVHSWMPAEHNGSDEITRFNPAPIRWSRTDSVTGYNDITPRMGAAYDLFGNGRTAIKVNAGKYLAAAVADGIYSSNSPANQYVRTISGLNGRPWTDNNNNFIVDCNLTNPAAQGPTAAVVAVDTCGALTGGNLNFGSVVPNTVINPDILSGWGVRQYNWNFGVSVQHAVLPRVSVDAGYNRRWWGNFLATVNSLVTASDYDQWTLPVPSNSKLPDGGGGTAQYVAITSAASARGQRNYQTKETEFAEARTAYWHGVDVNVNARMAGSVNLQAGTSTGHGVRNTCDLWRARPELQGSNRYDSCDVNEPWITSFRGLGSYRVPKAEVQITATVRSTRTTAGGDNASNGTSLNGNYQLPNTVVQQYLGRLPAGASAAQTTTVNVVRPGTLYPPDRRTQLDMRFAKILRVTGRRLDLGVDLYNLFNANTATSFDQTYLYTDSGASYLNPTAIMAPRLVRFNATLNF